MEIFEELRDKIRKRVLERIPPTDFLSEEEGLEQRLRGVIEDIAYHTIRKERHLGISERERAQLVNDIVDELIGLGPLEALLEDESVDEIMINGPSRVYVTRRGRLEVAELEFRDEAHLKRVVERILSPQGRRINEAEPFIDARLQAGARINVVIWPVSLDGTVLTIQKAAKHILGMEDLIRLGTLNAQVAEFLKACVCARLNIIICGGTSSGKTTTLNVLSSFISEHERIITIEDVGELRLPHTHVIRLEARPPTIEGKGEITIRSLLKNSLHMRPDRIIIGEVRGEEVWDMLQAMNTGHEGSMVTLHANSPYDALIRLEAMGMLGGVQVSAEAIRRQIVCAVDLVVQMNRFADGSRRLTQISALLKERMSEFILEDIFLLEEGPGGFNLRYTGRALPFARRLEKTSGYILKP